jgi:beta-ketodecanoyl-[acyl-carrier-protein] synthase
MINAVIAATGLYTPPQSLSNAELVETFNTYVERFNASHAAEIEAGEVQALIPSSAEFIEKASGIKSRFVVDKSGLVDPERMTPNIPERSNEGFAFDMNVACSSATFGIKTAADFVASGSARAVLMVNPEICSGHLNFRDRDSHFIFGDVATAVIVEAEDQATGGWDILGTRLKTQFSNNIRNNFGFLNRAAPEGIGASDKLFVQEGRKVFREVVPMVSEMIVEHARDIGIDPQALKRMWLHQANINMNVMIGKRVLGRDPAPGENVIILDEYANTSSAGSIIAFHKANEDFAAGETGLICSFGAGYSAGTVFVRKR